MELYCRPRHAAFQGVEGQPEVEDQVLAKMGHTLHVVLSVPSFTAVWRADAATDLVGMILRRLAERVAGPAGLEVYQMPFALPRAELCQAWHRRNSTARGLVWLRGQVAEILAKLDNGPNPVECETGRANAILKAQGRLDRGGVSSAACDFGASHCAIMGRNFLV